VLATLEGQRSAAISQNCFSNLPGACHGRPSLPPVLLLNHAFA
jgi:hypothetical protein